MTWRPMVLEPTPVRHLQRVVVVASWLGGKEGYLRTDPFGRVESIYFTWENVGKNPSTL